MQKVLDYVRPWVAGWMIAAVRCYQIILRPLTVGSCRYVPGCSEYFIEAIRVHGPWHGMILGLKRILRCRPGGGWGYDPVPPAELPEATTDGLKGKSTTSHGQRMSE